MDIDDVVQEAGQWKQKYFTQLEEAERREKQWNEADELLRKTISRLTLAADGLDDVLDRQLRELRNAIRDRAATLQLRTLIEDMSRTLVRLDSERTEERPAVDTVPLLDLLDALTLPQDARRKAAVLKKQLESHAIDERAAIQSFTGLVQGALAQVSGEAGQADNQAARSGLFQRLFGASESRDASAPADSGSRRAQQALQQTTESVRAVLLRLLECLSLPPELVDRVRDIRSRIEATGEGESWDGILEQIADLIQVIRARTLEEKQGVEEFLVQLGERFQEVNRQLQESGQQYDEALQAGEQLDSDVKAGMAGIGDSVRDATDFDRLRQDIQTHVDAVITHLDRHRETEKQRFEQAKTQIATMSGRLLELEKETAELRSRVKQERNQAKIDPLTGIPNRLAYEERLEQEVARWKRFATPLVLVMWDIDLFKEVNDRFGHRAGDKVLRTIARTLESGIRETDFVARYGGEEFVQLMTGSSLQECLQVAEKLRESIRATGFHFREQAITITASCGLAEFRDGDSIGPWFERADKALYRAKQEGRDRCVLAS
ncbi:MAG TPA: GGDEF domain-containing protein [Gammaproteobacteria bacterium]|nr:GGDEF domain-containing protein [Gammaproteobacteria bacterium]